MKYQKYIYFYIVIQMHYLILQVHSVKEFCRGTMSCWYMGGMVGKLHTLTS